MDYDLIIEELLEQIKLKVTCRGKVYDNGLTLYIIRLGQKSLGTWTEMGAIAVLCQLREPTNPPKWFKSLGIEKEAVIQQIAEIEAKPEQEVA